MVGMGSVVVKDVEDDWIVYGVATKKRGKKVFLFWKNVKSLSNLNSNNRIGVDDA